MQSTKYPNLKPQMSVQLKIFVTGATGFVGGSVLARLLTHPEASRFSITALVRSAEKGDKLKTLGVNVVVGSYSDKNLDFLTNTAAESDFVFAAANSDDLPPALAILKGMKIKYEKSGKAPVLIHTSGSAIITDDSRGLTSEHTSYSDLHDADKLYSLPEAVLHRNVDIPIVKADEEGYIRAYLVAPGTIFGLPTGPLVALGIQNTHSMQIPFIAGPSIARKAGGYFNKGLNTWSAVSLKDTVDFYMILFDAVLSNKPNVGHGKEGYYFVENMTYSGLDLASAVSEVLFEKGVAESKEPKAFEQAEAESIYGAIWPLLATNCYARGDRSRALGWNPTDTKADFISDVKREVKAFLA